MSSKGRLGLNLFEANLKRHPSVKGLFDEKGNKKSPSNSKNELLTLSADNKSEKDSNDTRKNQEEELEEKIKDFEKDIEKEDEKEKNEGGGGFIKTFSVAINRVEEKPVDNTTSFFTELDDEEKKQIIKNRDKYKKNTTNLSVPLSYEFNKEQKALDKHITEQISKGKNFNDIEGNLKYQKKDKNMNINKK